jgi:hypothetical protein
MGTASNPVGDRAKRQVLLRRLDDRVATVSELSRAIDQPEKLVVGDWTASDVLRHLTFWH